MEHSRTVPLDCTLIHWTQPCPAALGMLWNLSGPLSRSIKGDPGSAPQHRAVQHSERTCWGGDDLVVTF